MKNAFIISLVWNKKGETRKDGTAPVFICVYANGKRKYYNSKICVRGDEWDAKKQIIKKSVPNSIQKNKKLAEIRAVIEKHCFKLAENEIFELEKCFGCFGDALNDDFYKFVENVLQSDATKTTGTIKSRFSVLKCLKMFRNSLKFSDINFALVESFQNFLHCKGYAKTTATTYLRTLKTWCFNAMKKGFIKINPFDGIEISMPEIEREFLSETEYKEIENTNFENSTLQYCKDVFLFGVYTGLRVSDIVTITPENILQIGDDIILHKELIKTKRKQIVVNLPLNILFGGKALNILERYQNENGGAYFGKFSKVTIYNGVKKITEILGIAKNVSMHTARHTTATILLNKNIPLSNVSKILGHTNLSTTQIYAKLLDETINDNLKLVKW